VLILLTGGCKNGKSSKAEKISYELSKGKNLFYLATMISADKEDDKRIENHIAARAYMPFITIEKGRDISEIIADDFKGTKLTKQSTVLMDSLTALLSNEMFKVSDDGEYIFCQDAATKVFDDICALNRNVANLIIVSDYIQSDANIFDNYTEEFREGLAFLEKRISEMADRALEIVAGKELNIKDFNEIISAENAGMNLGDLEMNNDCFLVIGGAYQGKGTFVRNKFEIDSKDIYVCDDSQSKLPEGYKCYEHLEKYVYACSKEGIEPEDNFEKGTILVMDDIFCGVVPMDTDIRLAREKAGRYLQKLASHSEVYRVICGRGMEL
jgi:adenosyl cobinamide kinase/adenosyl cobinamide phosphate guanylyltransferase